MLVAGDAKRGPEAQASRASPVPPPRACGSQTEGYSPPCELSVRVRFCERAQPCVVGVDFRDRVRVGAVVFEYMLPRVFANLSAHKHV